MDDTIVPDAADEFRRGVIVLLTLNSPREKFWGLLLSVSAAGVAMRGIPLESFEDILQQVRSEEPADLSTVFFPLHRVERISLDLPSGEMSSLAEQFASRTGKTVESVFKALGEQL
ncbi:MAG TPA: hypothetical protein VMU24_03900 [Candidatus Acidoferrales bacterium]|nr:hypothetical protein [Candidatus Acidoferrales bacterium]